MLFLALNAMLLNFENLIQHQNLAIALLDIFKLEPTTFVHNAIIHGLLIVLLIFTSYECDVLGDSGCKDCETLNTNRIDNSLST